MAKAWLSKMWRISLVKYHVGEFICVYLLCERMLKVVLWTPMWPASPFWKIHKRWKVRFGVTHLQVDRRKSSVGLRDACKDVFLYVVENLQWISRVNEGCMQTQALKTMLFFSRVVLPNSNYWSQGFEIKKGFHSSMYLEISQRCGYSLDNFWTWTEINGSNLKAVSNFHEQKALSLRGWETHLIRDFKFPGSAWILLSYSYTFAVTSFTARQAWLCVSGLQNGWIWGQ